MDASPMSSGLDGSLVLGSKDTSLLLLDAATGQLLEEVSAVGGIVQIADMLGASPAAPPAEQGAHPSRACLDMLIRGDMLSEGNDS